MLKVLSRVRPGTVVEVDGKRYMRNRTSKGQAFLTPMWSGSKLFTDSLTLSVKTEVEVVDDSNALSAQQLRET